MPFQHRAKATATRDRRTEVPLAARGSKCHNSGTGRMTRVRSRRRGQARPVKMDGPRVWRFPPADYRPARRRTAFGAVITLVAFLGSLVAATLGPVIGETPPFLLLILMTLIRG